MLNFVFVNRLDDVKKENMSLAPTKKTCQSNQNIFQSFLPQTIPPLCCFLDGEFITTTYLFLILSLNRAMANSAQLVLLILFELLSIERHELNLPICFHKRKRSKIRQQTVTSSQYKSTYFLSF